MNAFQCDLTVDSLLAHVSECSVHIATLVFVLSAIHPDKMLAVLQNIIQVRILYFKYYIQQSANNRVG